MKTKISKLLAVGLTVALVASLMAFAVPATARTLGWSSEITPSESNQVIEPGVNVTDIAVAEDGVTIFAGGGDWWLYKSTDRGVKWSTINATDNTTFVAVAPDDADYIVVADSNDMSITVTSNGGITWGTLTALPGTPGAITDLDISAVSAGIHYIAVAGYEGSAARVWRYNVGSASPSWKDITSGVYTGFTSGAERTVALSYSPNFASDQVLVAVALSSTSGNVTLEIWSENLDKWNVDAGFAEYPAIITTDASITGADAASIALGPDYLGSDEAMRLAFVGLTLTGSEAKNGIHRMSDTVAKELKIGTSMDINSLAYDGAVLVAGKYDTNTVYYCLDSTVSSPTVSTTGTLKRPGGYLTGSDKVVLVWAGTDVVAGVSTKGAFAVSTDNGKSFNDISLVTTPLTELKDVAVSPDGSNTYLVSYDSTDKITGVWRKASSWERVLAAYDSAGADYIVRIAPDDPDVVYVANKGGTTAFYTADAGDTRWQIRTCRVSIIDMAVEGDGTVAYALTSTGKVSKSTNGGFTWNAPKDTKLTTGNMIISVGEGNLLVADQNNNISYSTDSADTWTKISPPVSTSTSGKVLAVATGLADDDYIYAALNASNTGIYRWQIGVSTTEWTEIKSSTASGYMAYGIALEDGVLYLSTSNGNASTTYRSLNPSAWPTAFISYSTMTSSAAFTREPQGLSVGAGKLWAVDTEADPNKVYSYEDTITAVAPTLNSPETDAVVPVNPIHGYAMDVTFSWQKPSEYVMGYELKIYQDSAARDERVLTVTGGGPPPTVAMVVGKDISGANFNFMPGVTYYWKVRVSDPIYSPYSEIRSFTVEEAEVTPPVIIPPAEAPEITITPPEVIVNVPPTVEVPAQPAPITPAWIYVIIFIGAVLLIAVIILIVRTRRAV